MLDMHHEVKTGADEKSAKKIAKKPKMNPKKKREMIFWVTLLVIVLGSLLFGAFKVMRVREVKFRGLSSITEEYAKGLAGVKKGTHIFNVDMGALEKNINADPYLLYEQVTYVFPDKLVVDVYERQERAAIAVAKSYVVIDENCTILRQTEAGDKPNAAQVVGLEISEFTPGYELRSTDTYQQDTLKYLLNALVYSGMMDSISQINIKDVNDIRLTTKKGMEVVLGQKENAPEKLLLAKSVIDYLANEGTKAGTLDVTTDKQASYMPEQTPAPSDSGDKPSPAPSPSAKASGKPAPSQTPKASGKPKKS